MAFSWENLGSALLGVGGLIASPFTGGISAAATSPFLAKGIGGLLSPEQEKAKVGLMTPEKRPRPQNQSEDYIAAIRRIAEG